MTVSTYMGETVTRVYNKLGTDVKEDYYHNMFDGNISWVFFDNNDVMVGFVLARDLEDHCVIFGYSACSNDVRETLFLQFVEQIHFVSKNKPLRRFKLKYPSIYAKCDSDDDSLLCTSIGFKPTNETDTYIYKTTMVKPYNYRKINFEAMWDTRHQYETNPELKQMVLASIGAQFMVSHDENIDQPLCESPHTEFLVTGNRSFHEARRWAVDGQKVAVLNFANNHSIGGSPFTAGAQEESLCRCSTLFPCLQAMKRQFYDKHCRQFENGEINYMGNDDLIYTPNVCVFKTDLLEEPIIPKTLPRDKWYMVDVITSAAPQLRSADNRPSDYETRIGSRIKKILDVAKQQGVDVLILGAWGCGAFRNPEDVMARVFHEQLKHYDFKKVVLPLSRREYTDSAFYKVFG